MDKEQCFFCDPLIRKGCDKLVEGYRDRVCGMIEKKNPETNEYPMTAFSLECPTHGVLATDMPFTCLSEIWDTHREKCKEKLTFLPQSVYERRIA
ncbi:hypothetical protein MUP56_00980 [Patescibacteria group bacterium]|nr:hypothetical protein [Patescibacteria group bacterium]